MLQIRTSPPVIILINSGELHSLSVVKNSDLKIVKISAEINMCAWLEGHHCYLLIQFLRCSCYLISYLLSSSFCPRTHILLTLVPFCTSMKQQWRLANPMYGSGYQLGINYFTILQTGKLLLLLSYLGCPFYNGSRYYNFAIGWLLCVSRDGYIC